MGVPTFASEVLALLVTGGWFCFEVQTTRLFYILFMGNSKRTRYGAYNITGKGRGGYFLPPFILDRGVMIGNTLEVVLRMVNDLGGKRNDQIYCIIGYCIWNGG